MPRTVTVVDASSGARADVRLTPSSTPVLAHLPFFQAALLSSDTTLSRNGLVFDERLLTEDLGDGDVITLGPVGVRQFKETTSPKTPSSLSPGPDGTFYVSRSPVVRAGPASPPTITFPELPPESPPQRLPLLATLAPLLGGVAMAAFLRRWEFLAFALMSPLVVVGQALSDRWHRRRSARRQRKDYDEHFAQSVVALEHALDEERRRRREESPDLDSVVTATRDRTALLWSRPATESETALTLRVGVGKVAADVVVQGGPNTAVVDDVPVLLRLGPGDVVGVCGADAAGAARALLVQAVTLNGPAAVSVSVIAPGRAREWSWTRWLPHTRTSDGGASVAFDAHGVSTLVRPGNRPGPRLVLVTGQADHAVVAKLTRESGATVVWVADDERQLPGSCNSILRTGTEQGGEGLLRTCGGTTRVQVESVTTGIADTVARSLAPLRDASPEASVELPTQVAWSELAELPLHDRDATLAAMCRRWAQPPTTEVTLGVGTGGIAVQVDLARHGPHALVAGTTGSGKSELLQSLVAGLVVGCSPADLSFLLLDYKGGATFGPFQRLPHTLAVLTDLDAAATTRVLRSLNAELRRRERIFATAGVADFDSLQRHRRQQIGSVASLARLVIVVDEFAALIEELPDFVGGLVGIAQRGRSLGVHLILATQRPEGAVSPDIRANTRLGICLAVTRESESRDVIDSPVAVTIQPTTPGRAWLRMDGQGLIEVQTARINCPTSTDDEPRLVSLWEWADPHAPVVPAEAGSQLEALIEAAVRASSTTGLPATPSPWLPPLPDSLPLDAPDAAAAPSDVLIGLVDLPDALRQAPLTLPLAETEPLLIVGSGRSGRTTAATSVAIALAQALAPDDLNIWAIDSGSGLHDLHLLPHTGAVVVASDPGRVERLLSHLQQLVSARRSGQAATETQLLLVVDSWDGLMCLSDETRGRCQDLLLRLLSDGPGAGLRVVITADRSGLAGRLGNVVADKIVLRLADRGDFALLGIAPRDVPTGMPAGRGLRSSDHALVQIAAAESCNWAAATAWPSPVSPPRRFDPLPVRLPLQAVLGGADSDVVIGVRADDLQPVVLDLDATGTLLVAGPSGSGRTTTLLSLAAQVRDRPVVAICGRRSQLARRPDLATVISHDAPGLVPEAINVASHAVLLVDDVDAIDDEAMLEHIEHAVRVAQRGAGFVALAGHSEALASCFRGPIPLARRRRAGLLLRPEGRHDGELLGVRLQRCATSSDPPGRGVLALDGTAVTVQVPDPG